MKTSVGIACAVFVAGLMSAPAWAQTPAAAPAPPPKNWTFTAGVDFPTAYVFRGIMQEKKGSSRSRSSISACRSAAASP